VLEREGPYVTGFKIYGHSQLVVDRMIAWVGFPERTPDQDPDRPSMTRGDLEDPAFLQYLQCLDQAGLI
jgi:hypothetical protein